MCTVNSLAWIPKSILYFSSLRTVLSLWIIVVSMFQVQDGSCARSYPISNSLAVTVTAPADMTISIKNVGKCDTIINLPPAAFNISPACIPLIAAQTKTVFGTLNTNGGPIHFYTGVYYVIYTLTDNCYMVGSDTMKITIFDATPPNVVCASEQTINLNNIGEGILPAKILDAGSTDDCSHVYFKAKRMSSPNGYTCTLQKNPNYKFDDEVLFCCRDIKSGPIRVILRVYDIFPGDGPVGDSLYLGHFRDCMVLVNAADKLGPTLTCPLNATVSCGVDIDSIFRKQKPLVSDNCYTIKLDSTINWNTNACGSGTVSRSYTATDSSGLSNTCTQTITVLGNSHFDGTDTAQLKWPAHTTVFACRVNLNTINGGSPQIVEDECDQVLVRKTDEKFDFNRGGVCLKLLRHWEVINYCKYNAALKPNPNIPSNGYYSYTQEIKIMDTISPVIQGLRDTLIKSLADNCGDSYIALPNISATDCGAQSGISYQYRIDFFSNGTIDRSGTGKNASGMMPMGSHILYLEATDSCHNTGILKVNLTIKDGKLPKAEVIYGLSTSLTQMPAGIMVMVNARLLNNSSTDNCTAPNKLKFSYSTNINDTLKIFTCDDIRQNFVNIYVWDECGNYSVVTTYIVVDDIDHLCPTHFQHFNVNGIIKTYAGIEIEDVSVAMIDPLHKEIIPTNEYGEYAFKNLKSSISILLNPSCDKNYLSGITTADITKIQQHILGIKTITNSYDLIAADVDQNGKISARDIIILRNLILGKINEMPENNSYLFIHKTYQFTNPLDPFDEYRQHKNIIIDQLESDHKIDFVAIKLGDINQSLTKHNIIQSEQHVNIIYAIENNHIIIRSNVKSNLHSLQVRFILDQHCSVLNEIEAPFVKNIWTSDYYNISKTNLVTISFNSADPICVYPGDILFDIPLHTPSYFCDKSLMIDQDFNSEWVDEQKGISTIQMQLDTNPEINPSGLVELIESGPNPCLDDYHLTLRCNQLSKVELELSDLTGHDILTYKYSLNSGVHKLKIPKTNFKIPGVYFLNLKSEKYNRTIKIIIPN